MNLKCDDIVQLIHLTIKCQVGSIDLQAMQGILNNVKLRSIKLSVLSPYLKYLLIY